MPVRNGSHVTGETLAEHAAARLASDKHPREITLVRKLPRNEMGKGVKRSRSLVEAARQSSPPPRKSYR
jgi:acyl-coenzyme A synthetase/AMP-(fatty) acid ligase